MMPKQPIGKMERTLAGGNTAMKVGGKVLGYYTKRPFMAREKRAHAKEDMVRESARIVFEGLSLLKGTALKMSQLLSLEVDLLPEAVRLELAKAYHQVPPLNKALVRKMVQKELGHLPEDLFNQFDLNAFAAASLGQVHAASDKDNRPLAVKIQYPGIAKTIENDIVLLGRMLSPLLQSDQLSPMMAEMSDRLKEEVDYVQEAAHVGFFNKNLSMEGVRTPMVLPDFSCGTILTTTFLPGKPLDQWLMDGPDQKAVDHVAQKIQDIFIKGLYTLNVVHADPNPGNYIIDDDLTIGLVDYGCVKRLSPFFVEHYRNLVRSANLKKDEAHFEEMIKLGFLSNDLPEDVKPKIKEVSIAIGDWFGRLCEQERFDFRAHKSFFGKGRKMMRDFHQLRQYVRVNPDFLFLDRTRYGLMRIFERMGAGVCFRNTHEWNTD